MRDHLLYKVSQKLEGRIWKTNDDKLRDTRLMFREMFSVGATFLDEYMHPSCLSKWNEYRGNTRLFDICEIGTFVTLCPIGFDRLLLTFEMMILFCIHSNCDS